MSFTAVELLQYLAASIGWRKNNRTHYPISYMDTLMKTGSERASIEAIILRRWILFAGFVALMEDTRLPKCTYVMFGELVRGACCVWGQEKEWAGCLLDGLRGFRHQRRPMDDDCSL